jgi:hypothetical protein
LRVASGLRITVVVLLTRALAYRARLIAPSDDRFREKMMLIDLGG